MNFKEYFLKEFRIPGSTPPQNVLPETGSQTWFIFKNGDTFAFLRTPCWDETPAIGSITFRNTYLKEEGVTVYSAGQLNLFSQDPTIKKSLLHIARGKETVIDKNFSDKLLGELVNKTINIMSSKLENPSLIVDVESKAPFNKMVLSGYNASAKLPIETVLKNTFGYLASKFSNSHTILLNLMTDTEYKKGSKQYKPLAVILSMAYENLLKDISSGKSISYKDHTTNKVYTIDKDSKLSIDTLAAVLSNNYVEASTDVYINAQPGKEQLVTKSSPKEKSQKEKWLAFLTDARSIKIFLYPRNFFIFDENFWQNQNNKTIVILDDNINSKKTFIEINSRIKKLAPQSNIVWMVGIHYLGLDSKKTPQCVKKS